MNRRSLLGLAVTTALGLALAPDCSVAQQPMPVIGYLSQGSEAADATWRLPNFRLGLNEADYVEGQNVASEYRGAENQYDRLPGLAADLVGRKVDVIATIGGTPAALAAKAATSTIPIVFGVGVDPVQAGLVASLNRPGGNITGVANFNAELAAKKLDLLRELVPTVSTVGLLANPSNPFTEPETRSLERVAEARGLQAHVLQASTLSEIDAAFGTLAELRVGALVVGADAFLSNRRDQIVALAARYAVPAIYSFREAAAAGGLISYGTDLTDYYRQQGILTAKILKGATPADLPVQQVVKLELVINLKTAKALGLTVPPTLLGGADDVIE
jgi:putative tryptophan/tyrosine transport system substrate-binding protein